MMMTVRDVQGLAEGQQIDVHVEHDDGWVSIAEIAGVPWRCYVNTAERRAHWEARQSAVMTDAWTSIIEAAVDLPQFLRVAMHRAAAAGLVAAGIRS